METAEENRRQRLKLLIDEFGSQVALGEKLGKATSQISQWVNSSKNSKTGEPRVMSHKTAREIEEMTGKPSGWMDQEVPSEGRVLSLVKKSEPADQQIIQYETGGRMGNSGVILRDQPGMIRSWIVSAEWVAKNVHSFTSIKNLAIVTGFGDSMRPLYNPGDPLLVDTGVRSVEFDGIYFFRVRDEGFVKRLQRIPGDGMLVISENDKYRDWRITDDLLPHFEVFGRIVKVWCGTDF